MSRKDWLSLKAQLELLSARGLEVDDEPGCTELLQRVGYYHLSGYARFFQEDPGRGGNTFREGTTFAHLRHLQELDELLRHMCLRYLGRVETALRTSFALRFGEVVGPYESLLDPASYHSAGATAQPVHELVLNDLNRCKAKFVAKHRREAPHYEDLPVWAAVEALSFGTLSKCIGYGKSDDVARTMANDFGVNHQGFSSQLRSFVSLRNECAHHSRLWNDVSKNPPSVPHNIVNRAKKRVGKFHPQSHFHVFVALDKYQAGRLPGAPALVDAVEALMGTNSDFKAGLLNPRPY